MDDKPPVVYFRNDDVAEYDRGTVNLLDTFTSNGIPIGLGVIPFRLTDATCKFLLKQVEANPKLVEFYQHGFAHVNHSDTLGRRYEFGPTRTTEQQEQDIRAGKEIMKERLGLEEVLGFVPPWHKFDESIFPILGSLDFEYFSVGVWNQVDETHIKATPIHLNMSDRDASGRWYIKSFERLRREFDHYIKQYNTFGFLLHHPEFHGRDDWAVIEQLGRYLREQHKANLVLMTEAYAKK